jgi:hypothetical protein
MTHYIFRHVVIRYLRVAVVISVALSLISLSPSKAYATKESPLIGTLKNFQSEYSWFKDVNRYVLNNKEELERIVASGDVERNIRILADCMDSSLPSKVMLDDKQVPLGMVCHEGLTLLIYYEPTTPEGDIAREWPGYVSPPGTTRDLRAAKKAWKKVIRQHSYKRL